MKNEYLYWKRITEQLEGDIEAAEASIMINKKFLWTARKELSRLPKPIMENKNEKK